MISASWRLYLDLICTSAPHSPTALYLICTSIPASLDLDLIYSAVYFPSPSMPSVHVFLVSSINLLVHTLFAFYFRLYALDLVLPTYALIPPRATQFDRFHYPASCPCDVLKLARKPVSAGPDESVDTRHLSYADGRDDKYSVRLV
ncbi:hypothetical protein B0H19DRAFT_121327 [Mycena capillaripes]|nr:hypothetical protein B0H19DRAFT_121327 [Mycena capillaripes]